MPFCYPTRLKRKKGNVASVSLIGVVIQPKRKPSLRPGCFWEKQEKRGGKKKYILRAARRGEQNERIGEKGSLGVNFAFHFYLRRGALRIT